MQISNIMSRNVEVIPPEASIQDAAAKMKSLDVGALPVCDGQRLLGMVTDRDITVRAVAAGCSPSSTPVREAMSEGACFCYDDEDVQKAAQLMEEKQIRRLPIVNRDKRLVGIVSLGDVATQGTSERQAGEALKQVSQPTHA